jgi:hypothetical protein
MSRFEERIILALPNQVERRNTRQQSAGCEVVSAAVAIHGRKGCEETILRRADGYEVAVLE